MHWIILTFTLSIYAMMGFSLGCGESGVSNSDSATPPAKQTASAIFAGGCFWGVEHHLQAIPGVHSVTNGYSGGSVENPTYTQVRTGETGHAEAVEVVYNPMQVNYAALAKRFFEIHDPTTQDRQGLDKGAQYRSAIFYANDDEKQTAETLIAQLRKNGYDVVTELVPATKFYPAEEYHQDYIENHPDRTCHAPVPRFGLPAK